MFAWSYEQVVLADRPIAYYRLDGNSANQTIVNSVSGQSTDKWGMTGGTTTRMMPGLPGAANPVACYIPQTIQWQGVYTAGWREPNPSRTVMATTTGSFSWECWLQPDALTSSRGYLALGRATGSVWYAGTWLWGTTNTLYQTWHNIPAVSATACLASNTWNHYVGIYGPSGHEMWVNGQMLGRVANANGSKNVFSNSAENYYTVAGVSGTISGGQNNLTQGLLNGNNPSNISSWNGGMAEVAEYSYALTPSQILNHYQVGMGMRRSTARLLSTMYPFTAAAPDPPSPGGLTPIGDATNRRMLLLSDRPR